MQRLEEYIAQFTEKTIAVAVHDLGSGRSVFINADETFHPASTFKVHVLMEVFHQAQAGTFSLDNKIEIINSFTSIADGSPYSLNVIDDAEVTLYPRIGEMERIRELARLMIVRSSNLATNILIEKVGANHVNSFVQSLGITGVTVRRGVEDNVAYRLGLNNSASARGLTQSMRLLAEGKAVSEKASQEMIDILLGQEFNESIPAMLPDSARVAHKTGWTGIVYHDTGIIFPQGRKPYAISIMTRGFAEERPDEAHDCMANISKIVYEELS
ncbi:MAG: serine hydrolase [Anaerolineales bacterium]